MAMEMKSVPRETDAAPGRGLRASNDFAPFLRALLGGVLLFILAVDASANVLYVGAGGSAEGCDFQVLHNALLVANSTAEDTTVYLATDMVHSLDYTLQFEPGDGKILIVGNHLACNQVGPDGTRAEIVSSDSTDPALTIEGPVPSEERVVVLLEDLRIDAAGGVGVHFDGHVQVHFRDVDIFGGTSGVEVEAGGLLSSESLAVYDHASPPDHAPILCRGATEVFLRGEVYSNESDGNGGGIRAEDGCELLLYPGTAVYDNLTELDGGGVHVSGGARLGTVFGSPGEILIAGNTAEGSGGGLYLHGTGTSATLSHVRVHSNFGQQGAAVTVASQADLLVSHPDAGCEDHPCSRVFSRNAEGSVPAAVIAVLSGGTARFQRTRFEDNRGWYLFFAADDASVVRGSGLEIWDNRLEYLMGTADAATVRLEFTSTALNSFTDLGGNEEPTYLGTNRLGGSLRVDASILANTNGVEPDSQVLVDCAFLSDPTGVTGTRLVVGQDPGFVSAATGDLHLLPSSPAIDYCDDPNRGVILDIDDEPRGFDHRAVKNLHGPFDLGADEFYGTRVFSDGFESGDSNRWK